MMLEPEEREVVEDETDAAPEAEGDGLQRKSKRTCELKETATT
jgi:hypothetical protein